MQSVAVPGSDDLAEISLVEPSCSLSASSCSTHDVNSLVSMEESFHATGKFVSRRPATKAEDAWQSIKTRTDHQLKANRARLQKRLG